MRQRLLRVAATLALIVGAGGAGVFFINQESGEVWDLPERFGALEVVDRSRCTVSVCNAAQCDVARDHLNDGGFTTTIPRFIECPFRIGQIARNLAADAGDILPSTKYATIRLIALCRSGACLIPTDENGWPAYAVVEGAKGKRMKPPGAACTLTDGGDPGDWNQYDLIRLVGAGCVDVAGGCIAGDCPLDPR